MRQHPPGTPTTQQIEETIEHLTYIGCAWPAASLRWRDQGLDQFPLGITQITGISSPFLHRALSTSIAHSCQLTRHPLRCGLGVQPRAGRGWCAASAAHRHLPWPSRYGSPEHDMPLAAVVQSRNRRRLTTLILRMAYCCKRITARRSLPPPGQGLLRQPATSRSVLAERQQKGRTRSPGRQDVGCSLCWLRCA